MEYPVNGLTMPRLLMVVVSFLAGMVGTRSVRHSVKGRKTDASSAIELPIGEMPTTSMDADSVEESARTASQYRGLCSSCGCAAGATITRLSSLGDPGERLLVRWDAIEGTFAYQLFNRKFFVGLKV